jgi:hypothetical protein
LGPRKSGADRFLKKNVALGSMLSKNALPWLAFPLRKRLGLLLAGRRRFARVLKPFFDSIGQQAKSPPVCATTGLPLETDIQPRAFHVSFGPRTDSCDATN